MKFFIQTACNVESQQATNPPHVVDEVIMPCFLFFHATALPVIINTKPEVDFIEFGQLVTNQFQMVTVFVNQLILFGCL